MGASALRRCLVFSLFLFCLAATAGDEEKPKGDAPPTPKKEAKSEKSPGDKPADAKGEGEPEGDKPKKLAENENLKGWLEENKEKNPELADLFEKFQDLGLDELIAKDPSLEILKNLLEKGAKPAPNDVKEAMRKAILAHFGFKDGDKRSRLPKDAEAPPKFSENQTDDMPSPELMPNPNGGKDPDGCGRCNKGRRGRRGGGGGRGGAHAGSVGGGGSEETGRFISDDLENIPLEDGKFADEGKLVPAGLNGRNSFEMVSNLGNGRTGHCQATLFETEEQASVRQKAEQSGEEIPCDAAMARHCAVAGNRKVQQFTTAYGGFTADRVTLSPGGNNSGSDQVFIRFSGETCRAMRAKKVPEVPLCKVPAQPGDEVTVETRYFAKRHFGVVTQTVSGTAHVNVDFVSRATGRHQGGIHTGDSGGPMFKTEGSGECLAGVLSASEQDAVVHQTRSGRATVGGRKGYYAMNLKFFREQAGRAAFRRRFSSVTAKRSFP